MARKRMDPALKQGLKNFGEKVGMAATSAGFGGEILGQASEFAVRHPYGAGVAGALIGAGLGAAGAVIHQRGIAVGQKHSALRNEQFNK